jgi:hypothetical protein
MASVADVDLVFQRALFDLLKLALDVLSERLARRSVLPGPHNLVAGVEIVTVETVVDSKLDGKGYNGIRRHAEGDVDLSRFFLKGSSKTMSEDLGLDWGIELLQLMFCWRQSMMFENVGNVLS